MGSENKPTDEEMKNVLFSVIATLPEYDRENIKELFCECYCKFTEEYMAMYKDVDEAMDNLMREKCEMCPLNEVIG